MKIKDSKSTRIQGEGNSIQYIFYRRNYWKLQYLFVAADWKIYDRPFVVNDSLSLSVINDVNGKLQNHNKLIRVQQGGRLIKNGYVDDSDGDQKIRSACRVTGHPAEVPGKETPHIWWVLLYCKSGNFTSINFCKSYLWSYRLIFMLLNLIANCHRH